MRTNLAGIGTSSGNKIYASYDSEYFEFEVEPPTYMNEDLQENVPNQSSETKDHFPPTEVQETEVEAPRSEPDYLLTRDRARRQTKPPDTFGYADLIVYALTITLEYEESEPVTGNQM